MIILKSKLTSIVKLTKQVNLTFAIKEMSEEDQLRLEQAKGEDGFLLFHGDEIKKSIEEAMSNRHLGLDEHGKSPSQKLRAALFQSFDQAYTGTLDWENFYIKSMEKLTNQVKNSYKK